MPLELIPNGDLVFKGPFSTVSTTTLKLSNNGNERLAYKIKTTAPKRYCVKPNSGFLEPHAIASVQVMLQPQPADQPDDRGKHKFMVQWVNVPANYTDDVDNFWKQDLKLFNVQDSKLKCVFAEEGQVSGESSSTNKATELSSQRLLNESTNTGGNWSRYSSIAPPQQTSPTLSTQRPSPSNLRDTGDDASKNRIKQEMNQLKLENENLRAQLEQQESTLRQRLAGSDRGGSPSTGRLKSSDQNGLVIFGINLNEKMALVSFLIALLFGFSLGYILFSCEN